jgi:hypothetical protein
VGRGGGSAAETWPAVPVGRQCRSGLAGSAGAHELLDLFVDFDHGADRKWSDLHEIGWN